MYSFCGLLVLACHFACEPCISGTTCHVQEINEMSQGLVKATGAGEESTRGSERRQSVKGSARHSIRSGRGRGVSICEGDSEYYDSYDEDDDMEYSCGHSNRKSGQFRPRRSRKSAHQREADLSKYTEDPTDEDLPEGAVARCLHASHL